MSQFEIENLTFYYPTYKEKPSLNKVNLNIEKGEYITICGRSGSGKTTLLKHLKTVMTPYGEGTGKVFFEGKNINDVDLREQSTKIGYVMQNPDNQIVTDKVWHELAFGLESLGINQKEIRLKVSEMASYFGIQSWFHKKVNELSGGQKQLLNLASIMAMQPSVLILDEPTSQLDPIAASDFLNTIRKINLELGITIIITEHRLEDIFHVSDRVVVMDKGMIIANDSPRNIGKFLRIKNNQMFVSMPSPMQIYYGVEGIGECPLTVREGRSWLSKEFNNKELTVTSIVENEEEEITGDIVLELKEVWFRYEKDSPDVLRNLSFQVPKESIFAIVGGNGTGKSTTLKLICNILKPYRGKIFINGRKIEKYKTEDLFKENLAMLPQEPQSLFIKKTVKEDLLEMLSRKERLDESKIMEVSEICEITDLLDRHPYDLSGGEQQRAALAKILLTSPKILLLDEATKGMDNFFKIKFAEIMNKLKKRGVTIIMVSHDIEFCAKYADYVSMFFDGSIITTNTAHKFFSKNNFYTTAANRMSRHLFDNAITNDDVIKLYKMNYFRS
ncbi:ABC transporter ATP-binding protein [uncultured Clostridium sp.]|uniref:ABC transporter ATP-binding protein n=1 Tax=uncultured Clostridium sp. TaxID=59620 RepID=UPI0025F9E6C3|nr:ATP-binding cassette domain-containing protein [uncultured Clostridium sp.]